MFSIKQLNLSSISWIILLIYNYTEHYYINFTVTAVISEISGMTVLSKQYIQENDTCYMYQPYCKIKVFTTLHV